MYRNNFSWLLVFALLLLVKTPAVYAGQEHIRIAFGSCAHQDKPLDILQNIVAEKPDAMLFLGDNIYGDTEDMDELQRKYDKLGANQNFIALKQTTEFHAIWDDHDFGENDAGKDYPKKHESKAVFMDFWDVPLDDPRRQRKDGIYHAKWMKTAANKTVHIIFPDLRFNRDDISSVNALIYAASRRPKHQGPYNKDETASKTMLGETQWQWLERELAKPADVKILASSLQVLADFTGWEAWHNFPYDINRLFSAIDSNNLSNIIFISGDTHWTEISRDQTKGGTTLHELTSSGLTEKWKDISPNDKRISETSHKNNYGLIDLVFDEDTIKVSMGAKDKGGVYLNQVEFELDN